MSLRSSSGGPSQLSTMPSPVALVRVVLSLAFSFLPVFGDGSQCLENFTCQMSQEKRVVTCSDSNIDGVPLCLHPRLLRISLHETGIKTIYVTSFMYYTDVRYVNLSHNKIENIEAKTFEYQSMLEELYLSENKLGSLEADTFYGLRNLTVLSLSGNLLEEIPDSVFRHLPQLEHLDLSHNRITTLKEHSFQGILRLTVLLLSTNRLSSLPTSSIRTLPHLAELGLGGNSFNTIREGDFEGLSSLTSLDLSQTNFSQGIAQDALGGSPQLRVLKLNDCRLKEVPSAFLREVPRLEEVQLSRNLFTTIHPGAFQMNVNLRVLVVSGCPNLVRVSEDALGKNINLQRLDLSRNAQLTYLPTKDLHFMPRLSFLDLHGNNLQYIPHELVSWSDVREWLIQDNPLVCNCSALWLRDLLLQSNHTTATVTCKSPPDLDGVPLTSTSLVDLSCSLDTTTQGIVIGVSICGVLFLIGCVIFVLLYKNRSSCIRQLLKGHKLERGRSATHREYDSKYPYMKPVQVTEL